MEETVDHLKDLKEIRNMMEKSTRFISLSGLSGIFAGMFALIGAAVAFWYLDYNSSTWEGYYFNRPLNFYSFFFLDAGLVFILAFASGIFFTARNAKRKGQNVWDSTSKRLLINLLVPLFCGGFFCVALLVYGIIGLIAPATLIFYGLALLNGSKYTLDDIRYLAYGEIVLGMISTVYTGYGLLFWAIGFGVLHIVYGTVMYFKYEK